MLVPIRKRVLFFAALSASVCFHAAAARGEYGITVKGIVDERGQPVTDVPGYITHAGGGTEDLRVGVAVAVGDTIGKPAGGIVVLRTEDGGIIILDKDAENVLREAERDEGKRRGSYSVMEGG